jgi:hypothetical protein
VSPAERWLRSHLADAPPRLLETMLAALPSAGSVDDGDAPVADALAEGALALYRAVIAGSGGREDALPLLAADALMTHALEAQAEADPEGIAAFADRWGAAGRLGELAAAR